ncbi:hypothetical protein PVAND_001269 [Polypedilum vanderplanki]|uniref:Uncharacterized protein n=1 Tax=Polypedilum vanderplanki TaxID=319348 RepID=A0A9J6BNQ9_POLVA|nr:hypothetical protein PVAND_001269 [Polypedilum vanderplanki]
MESLRGNSSESINAFTSSDMKAYELFQTEEVPVIDLTEVLSGLSELYLMISHIGDIDKENFICLEKLTENLHGFISTNDKERHSLSTDFKNIRCALLYFIQLHENQKVELYQNLVNFTNICCYCVVSESKDCTNIEQFMKIIVKRSKEGGTIATKLDSRFSKPKINLIKRQISHVSSPIVMLSSRYEILSFQDFMNIPTDAIEQQHLAAFKNFKKIYDQFTSRKFNKKTKEILKENAAGTPISLLYDIPPFANDSSQVLSLEPLENMTTAPTLQDQQLSSICDHYEVNYAEMHVSPFEFESERQEIRPLLLSVTITSILIDDVDDSLSKLIITEMIRKMIPTQMSS